MRSRFGKKTLLGLMSFVAVIQVGQSAQAQAQAQAQARASAPEPRPATAKDVDLTKPGIYYGDPARPNISGFWRPDPKIPLERFFLLDGTQLPLRDDFGQDKFPYRPAWQAAYEARRAAEREGKSYGDPSAACWPSGLYKNYVGYPSPMEITQTPGRVLVMFQRMSPVRRVYTDGRGHLTGDALIPTALGDSIGHWEGNSLVVDTIGFRREFTLSASPGMPHSEQLHITERFTRVDAVTLTIEVTLDDPKAFTQPVRNTLTYKLWANDAMIEDFCVDNNRDWPDENLVVQMDTRPRKRYGFDLPE